MRDSVAAEAAEPRDRPVYLWDDQLKGFGAEFLPSGERKYVLKYRAAGGGRGAPQRWLSLGRHGAVTVEQARTLAQAALAAVARGEDPQAERLAGRTAPTVAELWRRYEADHLPRKKPKSQVGNRQLWRDYVAPALARDRVADVATPTSTGCTAANGTSPTPPTAPWRWCPRCCPWPSGGGCGRPAPTLAGGSSGSRRRVGNAT